METSLPPAALSRLQDNLWAVQERLRQAELRAGRPPGSCQLLAVVKKQPSEVVAGLRSLGQEELAENRVQALAERPEELREGARWHLIGHLQTNKARRAVTSFHCFHGVDSLRLARLLDREALRGERRWPIYLQMNVGEEPQKYGAMPGEMEELCGAVRELEGLELRGLMAMAPYHQDPEHARPYFRKVAETSRDLRARDVLPDTAAGLSMGMSGDFEVAVEEGATVVRVGTALFEGVSPADPILEAP